MRHIGPKSREFIHQGKKITSEDLVSDILPSAPDQDLEINWSFESAPGAVISVQNA